MGARVCRQGWKWRWRWRGGGAQQVLVSLVVASQRGTPRGRYLPRKALDALEALKRKARKVQVLQGGKRRCRCGRGGGSSLVSTPPSSQKCHSLTHSLTHVTHPLLDCVRSGTQLKCSLSMSARNPLSADQTHPIHIHPPKPVTLNVPPRRRLPSCEYKIAPDAAFDGPKPSDLTLAPASTLLISLDLFSLRRPCDRPPLPPDASQPASLPSWIDLVPYP